MPLRAERGSGLPRDRVRCDDEPVHVTHLGEDDWRQLREIRLRSLTEDDPVLASVEREQGFKENHWRMRLRGSPWFVATHDRRAVGLVSVIREPGTPADERHVVGLWVVPEMRGLGVGEALIAAAAGEATAEGAARLTAWVLDGDEPVETVLRASGFAPSGVRMPVPRDRSLTEERWTRALGSSEP